MASRSWRVAGVLVAAVAVSASLTHATGQNADARAREIVFSELTVPADRLPEGCALKTITPRQGQTIEISGSRRRILIVPATFDAAA
jgi:hypothetical protein